MHDSCICSTDTSQSIRIKFYTQLNYFFPPDETHRLIEFLLPAIFRERTDVQKKWRKKIAYIGCNGKEFRRIYQQ